MGRGSRVAAKTGFTMEVPDPWALAWKELNDQGNADRLVAHAGGLLVYVRGWGWLAYEAGHWSRDDGERLARLKAMDVARGMRAEMEALEARLDAKTLPQGMPEEVVEERIGALAKHAQRSGDSSRTKAMLEQAANLNVLNRRDDEFDADPLALNTRNRTLRFVQGDDQRWIMRDAPHEPEDLLTRQCAADWEPGVVNPMWLQHMETVLPDPAVRWFFQKLMGYCATGLNVEQIFVILQGKGGDGKSTAMNAVRIVLGSYAVAGKVQTFLDGPDADAGGATPELVRFVGDTRLISIQEPKRGKALAEERVKQFTGGSPVPYRPLYGAESEFEPRGTVVMEANKRPRISGDDDGIWRRIVIMLWRHQFKGTAIVKGYHDRILRSEGGASGVLNWIIDGVLGYLNEGLEQPQEVIDAIEEYRRSANPFSEWAHARLDLSDPMARELSADLYADYKAYCEAESLSDSEVMNSTRFGRALGDLQIIMCGKDSTGKKLRRGARLRAKGELLGGGDDGSAGAGDDGWVPPL